MDDMSQAQNGVTRRRMLAGMGSAGLGLASVGSAEALLAAAAQAAKTTKGRSSLGDIDHVIVLMQENRSFDHYFGTLSGVRGFGDAAGRAAFAQRTATGGVQRPYHLHQGCFPDITHDWGPQHQAYNHGAMNRFLSVHDQTDGPAAGVATMGYYTRDDLPFMHALADAFTICDGYHCSVIGPTDPNRLMSVSATIDPAGQHGGPLLQTNVANRSGRFSWRTMPEQLQAKGINWKVYTSPSGGVLDNVLTYFDAYGTGSTLAQRGLKPKLPDHFLTDLHSNRLPQVSWLLAGLFDSEHPDFSTPAAGEAVARMVVEALLAKPDVFRRTALLITWDENGGFFDHVAPPVAPPGTPGEYLTVTDLPSSASGIRGPVGLGFRVPMLVVSPFSTGGLVCSDTLDHTSTLRLMESRFRVRVPNLSAWRRRTTGDLTGAFDFAAPANLRRPRLPGASTADPTCRNAQPVVANAGAVPTQERRPKRRHPSGLR